ncbi:MAG: RNA polymerase sigma factor [Clostridia bacterium]|nr:RNA polymerase sigma factor [Clostridia bacterium]
MDDGRIVDLFLARDEAAIAETSLKYGAAIRRTANALVRDEQTARECENDTYLEAWNRIPPNEPREHLFCFLGAIARHIAIDRCRRNEAAKRSAVFVELTGEMAQLLPSRSDTEKEIEARELAGAVSAYLKGLPKEQRMVFIRRVWYFDSIAEIAERFGFSESKVKSMLKRTRDRLKAHLIKEGLIYERN